LNQDKKAKNKAQILENERMKWYSIRAGIKNAGIIYTPFLAN